jgi:hypothetical protein
MLRVVFTRALRLEFMIMLHLAVLNWVAGNRNVRYVEDDLN